MKAEVLYMYIYVEDTSVPLNKDMETKLDLG
jgi:hypothetical protein